MNAIRVALVDDARDIRFLVRDTLERDNRFVVVGEAADGLAGIDLVAAELPDIVLLDLAMPVMDGLEAIPQMSKRSPETKIVVLSAYSASTRGTEALEAGAVAYVEKSRLFTDLVDVMVRVAAG